MQGRRTTDTSRRACTAHPACHGHHPRALHPRTLARSVTLAATCALAIACGSDDDATKAPATPPAATPPAASPAAPAPAKPAPPASPAPAGQVSLPSDVPVFPGATITASGGDGSDGVLVSMTAKGAPPDVIAFYRERLTAASWRIDGETTTADGAMLIASQPARQLTVLATPDTAGVEISITVTKETESAGAE